MEAAHTHTHSHGHAHDYSERSHPEYVVLDIGDRYGALIVETDAEMHGTEIEISASGAERDGRHKQVLERTIGERPAYTLVFDKLAEGSYTLWVGDEPRARDVRVDAAEVTELDWRATAA
jgi:hypothetical protein